MNRQEKELHEKDFLDLLVEIKERVDEVQRRYEDLTYERNNFKGTFKHTLKVLADSTGALSQIHYVISQTLNLGDKLDKETAIKALKETKKL